MAMRPRAVSAGRVQRATSTSTSTAGGGPANGGAPLQRVSAAAQQQQQQQQQGEDPNEVARHILDLRERREASSSLHKRKPMDSSRPSLGGSNIGPTHSKSNLSSDHHHNTNSQHHSRPKPASPQGRVLQKAGSNLSQEEIVAEERLKRAENKITGLLDELEELKFFQELESETPSATTPKTPSQKSAFATPRNNASTPRSFHHQPEAIAIAMGPTPQDRAPSRGRDTSRGRGDPSRTADIPITIRTESPARAGRLPPPPPTPPNAMNVGAAPTPRSMPLGTPMAQHVASNGNTGGLETYKPLSPRSIAKLDRNSLELECQTLVRKLQIVEQERNSQSAMVEMYEISLQDHDADKSKIQKLQGELGKISGELKRQLQSITKGKESLMKEYEQKMQQNLAKMHRIQEKADSYKMDLDVTKEEGKRAKQEAETFRTKAKEEKARVEESKSRESVLEQQLGEARNLNATLVEKVENKRNDLASLQNDLAQTNQQLRDTKVERDEAYESKLAALHDELTQTQDKYTRVEQDFRDRDAQATEHEKRLDMAQIKDSEQTTQIDELLTRVEELEKETIAKFEEGKKASKTVETKKMQKLVADRANQSREYERRIKAMQEQLQHQADRHHADIQETRRRNDDRLESMRDEIRDEVQIHEGEKLMKLETELSVLRRTYDESKDDYAVRLKEAQQKSRDAVTDFQRQDKLRQQELDRLHQRMENYVNEISSKESEIGELTRRLEESRKGLEAMEAAKTHSIAELMKKDDLLGEERETFSNKELEFNAQMDAVKADFAELENRLRAENHELQDQVDKTHRKLSQAKAAAEENQATKEKLDEVQTAFDDVQNSLQDGRARHEEVESEFRVELAKMEGKLRASESSLKTKKSRVQELERQLDVATTTSSKVGEERQTEIESLRKRLEDTSQSLDSERERRQEKENAMSKLQSEVSTLQEKVESMNQLEDIVRDLKRRATEIEYEASQKDSELAQVSTTMEQYEKSIKDLESKLAKEHDANLDLELNKAELTRKVESMEREKVRKETELGNLRKDYEDLSGLLEDNLHSSGSKDGLDIQVRRREREMREQMGSYSQNVHEVEQQLSQSEKAKDLLEFKLKKLQSNVDDLNDEKLKLRSDLSNLRQKYDNVCFELDGLREQAASSGIEPDVGRKDRHMREAIQRYTQTIADLESKLEEEMQSKAEMEDRLSSVRSEVEDKQSQIHEMIQKHSKATRKLEVDFNASKLEKEDLQTRLDQTNKDLEQKRRELKKAMSKFSTEVSELSSVKQEHVQMSESTREELERKTKQLEDLKQKIPELLAELQVKNRECEESKASAKRYETELNKRKEHFNDIVKRYTDQIAALESQLDEHTVARSTTDNRVEVKNKDKKLRELQDLVTELETKLEIAQKNKESAKLRADSIARELDDKESDMRKFEMEKIELETKLHAQTRSKDELRSKVTDLSSKLERKEREVREVTDRYKMYVMELESKLDQDTDAKHQMQLDIDRLKNNLNSAVEVSSEAGELREQVFALETEIESYRVKAHDAEYKSKESTRSLEVELADAIKARDDIDENLKKTQGEKAEVIAALEGVINEVQNREDEIESLSELLHRRDEELQHAKIIATKALESAKDIQKRFKARDKTQQSDLLQRMDELSDNVDTLSNKNETLQRKIAMLERDLRDRNLECKRLKDQLRHIDANSLRDSRDPIKDDGSAFTHSTYGSSRGDGSKGLRLNTGASLEPDGIGLGADSFSPSGGNSPTSPADAFGDENMFSKEVEFPAFDQKLSGDFSDEGAGESTIDSASRWSNDFESDNRSAGFDSIGSSRKSIERDALRKYVKSRYMSKR
jgi:chromosome segregation protein